MSTADLCACLWYDYESCHPLSTTYTDCVPFVQFVLYGRGISTDEKSQCPVVTSHFTPLNFVSALPSPKNTFIDLVKCSSKESQRVMGALFHSVCQSLSYRPQLHASDQATVTNLHLSAAWELQTALNS